MQNQRAQVADTLGPIGVSLNRESVQARRLFVLARMRLNGFVDFFQAPSGAAVVTSESRSRLPLLGKIAVKDTHWRLFVDTACSGRPLKMPFAR